MKINYQNYLNKHLINVFIDVLKYFELNGIQENHHLYVTFDTQNSKVKIPKFLKDKYPHEMTIVIQYEYWDLKVKTKSFSLCLSFNGIKTNLDIPFNSVKSFADPHANFGLKITNKDNQSTSNNKKKKLDKKIIKQQDNVIQFKKKLR